MQFVPRADFDGVHFWQNCARRPRSIRSFIEPATADHWARRRVTSAGTCALAEQQRLADPRMGFKAIDRRGVAAQRRFEPSALQFYRQVYPATMVAPSAKACLPTKHLGNRPPATQGAFNGQADVCCAASERRILLLNIDTLGLAARYRSPYAIAQGRVVGEEIAPTSVARCE